MTKISDLPVNLVEKILSRVPLKYMRAVRSTCKEWDTLSQSRSFSKMHTDKISAGDESMMVAALMGFNLYLMKVVLVDNEDPLIECKGKLNKKIRISQVFHCDGLLLCVLKDDVNRVIVWNPYWAQTRTIEFRCSVRPNGWDWFSYALGYEDKGGSTSFRTYKFLRFIDWYHGVEDKFLWYEVYDFESSSWKTLDITPHWNIRFYQRGVSLKGNTYWLASPRNIDQVDARENHIICFDFTSESFGPLLRLPFDARYHDRVTLSCVREEKLAVLTFSYNEAGSKEFEMWITTKIEAEEVSWSKFLRVVDPLISCNCFFIDEEKKVVMGFEDAYSKTFNIVGEAGFLKKLKLKECLGRDVNWMTTACSYVRSRVNIKQPAEVRGKRKQQSEFEKKR